jgi:hypothetical protein
MDAYRQQAEQKNFFGWILVPVLAVVLALIWYLWTSHQPSPPPQAVTAQPQGSDPSAFAPRPKKIYAQTWNDTNHFRSWEVYEISTDTFLSQKVFASNEEILEIGVLPGGLIYTQDRQNQQLLPNTVLFFDFAAKTSRELFSLPKNHFVAKMSIAPDYQTLVYTDFCRQACGESANTQVVAFDLVAGKQTVLYTEQSSGTYKIPYDWINNQVVVLVAGNDVVGVNPAILDVYYLNVRTKELQRVSLNPNTIAIAPHHAGLALATLDFDEARVKVTSTIQYKKLDGSAVTLAARDGYAYSRLLWLNERALSALETDIVEAVISSSDFTFRGPGSLIAVEENSPWRRLDLPAELDELVFAQDGWLFYTSPVKDGEVNLTTLHLYSAEDFVDKVLLQSPEPINVLDVMTP